LGQEKKEIKEIFAGKTWKKENLSILFVPFVGEIGIVDERG
jgi:hypothetical protein